MKLRNDNKKRNLDEITRLFNNEFGGNRTQNALRKHLNALDNKAYEWTDESVSSILHHRTAGRHSDND